ncbi:hypothetical protein DIPPA_03301 [Diplonema papillatum]|nr:hypothetical protein DIPPA_03301 [Diplonema papillatum]
MKLSEMDPATNALHKAFEETSLEFLRTEPWSEFPDVHFGFTFRRSGQQAEADERSDFCCGKYVKQKLQIFRDYGDLLQTERSNDVQIYAAPEGQVELEVRPERLAGSEEKQLRP